MARGGKKDGAAAAAADPEAEERLRRKKMVFSRNILSQTPVKVGSSAALGPSKTVIKHHGRDILRKSQRKNKYLFSFPGLLGPMSGGKIGELKDLGTKNPILYLDFPQGQMKLFGTIVFSKNRYLTLQFSKTGKNVTCDEYFENMIVFSDAWWIGTKEENPEELRLEFPKELNKEKHVECDFKGGVGAASNSKQGSVKSAIKCLEQESTKVSLEESHFKGRVGGASDSKQGSVKSAIKCLERESTLVNLEDDLTESPNDYKELVEVTPTRRSARTTQRTFKFAESSGDSLTENGSDTPEEEDDKLDDETTRNYRSTETESTSSLVFEGDTHDIVKKVPASRRYKQTEKAKGLSDNQHTPLVQTTLSSLFKKVEEKKEKKDAEKITDTSEASKPIKGRKKTEGRKSGMVTKNQKKQHKIEEDDIEEFSSEPEDMCSDEDWTV